jgi:hypothetical protein
LKFKHIEAGLISSINEKNEVQAAQLQINSDLPFLNNNNNKNDNNNDKNIDNNNNENNNDKTYNSAPGKRNGMYKRWNEFEKYNLMIAICLYGWNGTDKFASILENRSIMQVC